MPAIADTAPKVSTPDMVMSPNVVVAKVGTEAAYDVSPAAMLIVLKKLLELKINNNSFRRLHQSGKTIRSVEAYCETTVKSFIHGDNNERLCRRMVYVLEGYIALNLHPGNEDVFSKLADMSMFETPPLFAGR